MTAQANHAINYTFSMHVQSVYLVIITIDVVTFTCIHAVTGIPAVLISALLGIIIIVIAVTVTVVVAFVVWKRKPGMCTFYFCW